MKKTKKIICLLLTIAVLSPMVQVTQVHAGVYCDAFGHNYSSYSYVEYDYSSQYRDSHCYYYGTFKFGICSTCGYKNNVGTYVSERGQRHYFTVVNMVGYCTYCNYSKPH